MSPVAIAIVSVVVVIVLMIAVKILIGSMLHNEDKARADQQEIERKRDD